MIMTHHLRFLFSSLVLAIVCSDSVLGRLGEEPPYDDDHGDAAVPASVNGMFHNPLRCTLASKHPEGCIKVDGCVWCRGQGLPGICVSKDQSESLIRKLPSVDCFEEEDSTEIASMIHDPLDQKCLVGSSQSVDDDARDLCESGTDSDGSPCVFCNAANAVGLCLNAEQAELASQFASQYLECDLKVEDSKTLQDPLDQKCLAASSQTVDDASRQACETATDSEGESCVFCNGANAVALCLNHQQAEMASQFASQYLECDLDVVEDDKKRIQDPLDQKCLAGSSQSVDDDARDLCESGTDSDGNPCVFCNAANAVGVCLNAEQAELASQFASQYLECDLDVVEEDKKTTIQDPLDQKCLAGSSQSVDDDARDLCESGSDSDGNACVFCNAANAVGVCLNAEQAELASQFASDYLECDLDVVEEDEDKKTFQDPLDQKCLAGSSQSVDDDARDLCESGTDSDGNPCVFCNAANAVGVCLNAEQAELASQFASDYLECDIETAVMKDEEPNRQDPAVQMKDPLDPKCLNASSQSIDDDHAARQACDDTVDSDGQPCVWCNGAGAFSLCLSHEQAEMASKYLECDANDDGTE